MGECIVLDEMNRADLDRCIGELYPLLSRNVDQVEPAGIPGVRAIRQNDSFRIVATVNDATLDDIVFPISQELARRFVRIEMKGACREDLEGFMRVFSSEETERNAVALEVAKELLDICKEEESISRTSEELPFVGPDYFFALLIACLFYLFGSFSAHFGISAAYSISKYAFALLDFQGGFCFFK